MDLPEYIESNVRVFMKPIKDAGYTNLPYDKSTGSLETQLRSYLLFAFEEQTLDRVTMIWDGGGFEVSNFSLTLNTSINREPIQFVFKGKFDSKYENPAQLSGLQVIKADHKAFYPYNSNSPLPEPMHLYQASIQPVQIRSSKGPRLIKKWLGKSKKL